VRVCPACATENPEHARFCLACGTALADAAPSRGEERKVVSVLFADLVGFTASADRADPEEVLATLRPYHALLRTEIERYGGTVEKFIGDAVMAVFGAPVAHEDDAERAVRAGLRITEALAELNRERPGSELAVRIAVNTGEAIVTLGARPEQGEGMVAGDVVNTASRLQQIAPVGSVVVGEDTRRATEKMIDYEPMDAVELKGKAELIPVWRATQAKSRYIVEVDRPTSPFIGREAELELLKQAYRRMIRESSVQLVTVTGEPGVGKSRLIGEFFNFVDAEPGEIVHWRHGRCLPYGDGVTFWALGEIVKAQAGILESDGAEEADDKLRQAVELVVDEGADREWLVAQLAPLVGSRPGSTPSSDRAEAFSAWRTFLEALAAFRPLILVIEDLHWADEAMIDFVEHLADWVTGVPLLILCTARPELYERRSGWGGGKRNSTTVALSPLQADEIAALVSSLLNETLLPAETQSALLERAGGNPLYAEEFVRMLTDRGILQRRGRAWQIATDGDIPVPDTVQALIAARMDTLNPDRKALLHDAAVVGRVFWPGALATMGEADRDDVVKGLHDLLRKEMVRPVRRSSMQGEEEFTFWHILVRDVAYAQIPRAQRAARHRRAAGWIEETAGERVADHADILAHHYLQALELGGTNGEEADVTRAAAAQYLYLAGQRASQLDRTRAGELFGQALALVPTDSIEAAETHYQLAGNYFAKGRQIEAAAEVEAAVGIFTERGELIRAAEAMAFHSLVTRHLARMDRSRELLAGARQILEGQPPSPELARVYTGIGGDAMLRSQYPESQRYAQKAIDMADEIGQPQLKVRPLQYRAWARWDAGDPEGAVADMQESIELGHRIGETAETSVGYNNYGGMRWMFEGPVAGLETYGEGIAFSTRRGGEATSLWSRGETTWPLYDLGRWDEILEAADEVGREAEARDWSQIASLAEPQRVKVVLLRGDTARAAEISEANLPAARQVGDPQLLIPALESQALVSSRRGEPQRVIEALLEIERITAETTPLILSVAAEAVRLAVGAGDLDLAHRLQAANRGYAGRSELILATGAAILAEADGRLDEAAPAYLDVAQRWAAYGNVIEEGYALTAAGRCLIGLGRGREAVQPLRTARELLAAPAASVLVADVDNLLADTAARAG
jgi:class 3 adenylate cyclase/tetratricopeptide (TPR) repeat protein